MRAVLASAVLLMSASALAQKPWETRIDLRVPLPIEFPAVAPANPFASAVQALPLPKLTPMLAKYVDTFTVQAGAYISSEGTCRRAVLLRVPWPGVSAQLQAALAETTFVPARFSGGATATWLPLAIDLKGRVDEGKVLRIQPSAPDTAQPPTPDRAAAPTPDPGDVALPATSVEQLEQMPVPKKFRARIDSRLWQTTVRVLVEVVPEGRCQRVIFLSCPDGLRPWFLSSLTSWTFQPAKGQDGPVAAWVQLEVEMQVETGALAADAVRFSRVSAYPYADAQPAGGPPPGV